MAQVLITIKFSDNGGMEVYEVDPSGVERAISPRIPGDTVNIPAGNPVYTITIYKSNGYWVHLPNCTWYYRR